MRAMSASSFFFLHVLTRFRTSFNSTHAVIRDASRRTGTVASGLYRPCDRIWCPVTLDASTVSPYEPRRAAGGCPSGSERPCSVDRFRSRGAWRRRLACARSVGVRGYRFGRWVQRNPHTRRGPDRVRAVRTRSAGDRHAHAEDGFRPRSYQTARPRHRHNPTPRDGRNAKSGDRRSSPSDPFRRDRQRLGGDVHARGRRPSRSPALMAFLDVSLAGPDGTSRADPIHCRRG